MLLTSWVESMRVAFEKSRKATLNPRRRLQLRSVPSSARQKVQRRVAIEQLEDRTLLTSLIINQLTAGLGVTINNSVLDPDADGYSNYDSIIFEDLTVNSTSGAGISIDLSGLDFQNDELTDNVPFSILFDNVTVNAAAGSGIDIDLDGLTADSISIAVDSSTITGAVGNAFNIDLTDIIINEFNIIDSTLSGQSGAGVTVAMSNTFLEETSIRRSNIDGVSIDVADGSTLLHTTLADNTIAGTSGNDGVSVNIVDSIAEELRLTNNNSIEGVSINVDDTAADGAALLTELYIHSNVITGNTAGAGVSLNLNNVDQFVSITGNSISSNSGHGIVFDQTDGDLSGDISDNVIFNNTGHGIYFTPSTTNPVPTDAAPGVPAYAGVPGSTDKIDFAAPRNEVQLISFAGIADGGSFTLTYTDSRGVQFVTDGISHVATAAQVKTALLNATPVLGGGEEIDIDVDDILVNGNVTDGYEIEFVNDLAGRNMSLLTVDPTGLLIAPATVARPQTNENTSEVQFLYLTEFSDIPTYGYFSVSLYGFSRDLSYDLLTDLSDSDSAAGAAAEIATAINSMASAELQLPTVDPLLASVVYNEGESRFEVTFDSTQALRGTDVPQITIDDSGLNYSVLVTTIRTGTSAVDEQQRLQFRYRDGNSNSLESFRVNPFDLDGTTGFITNLSGTPLPNNSTNPYYVDLFFDDSGVRVYLSEDPVEFSLRLETALNALDGNTTDDDFNVSGDFASGFDVTFIGAHDKENVDLIETTSPLLVDLEEDTGTEGFGQNEVQTITFDIPAQGGFYTITVNTIANGSETTGDINFDATAAEVQNALEGLTAFDPGDVIVTGSMASGQFQVEFTGQYRALADPNGLPELLIVNSDDLDPTVPHVVAITEGTSHNEVQEIVINAIPHSGSFTLEYNGQSTAPIAHDATVHDIWLALTDGSIPALTGNDVFVREVIYGEDPTNQGLEFSGFEIEFTGRLAGTNTSQLRIVADSLLDDDSNPLTTVVKTTTVGGSLRGISGNTITGNTGAGIEIDLAMYTSFYGDITGNTISSNETQGINLIAADDTTLQSIDFSLSVDGNTLDDNRGAAIAVNMEDTAIGDVSITGNTITNTRNDLNAATPYTGDAIYVDLYGTDVSFEAFSQLRDLTIDGNYLGTDAAGTGGQGNQGNGIGIHIEETTIIDRTQISNNVILNNTGDGLNFHRQDDARVGHALVNPIVGEERAVMIYSNTIMGNSDGIDILAQNGSLTTTDFEIKDNIISANRIDGIHLHAEADASIFADIMHNAITLNGLNGIESTTRTSPNSYFGTDRRDVSGTWIQNDISNNALHGIRVSGRIGNRIEAGLGNHLLFIGLNGVDPASGMDRGNIIEANGGDGIQIAAHLDRVQGNVKIANNIISSNQTGGIELLGESLNSTIDNNLISENIGKGIDINSNGQTVFLRNNTITDNTADGIEILGANLISHTEYGITTTPPPLSSLTSVTAVGNFIDNNGGRGVDLQTEEQADTDIIFGDGTEEGANWISSNALEGFYVVTTASRGQNQDVDSTDTLDATGAVESSHADMVLQLDTNYIRQNGVSGNFSSNGLVLRIGTMAGEHVDYDIHTPGTDAGTGSESSIFGVDGRSNVSVTNNVFEGNFGEDFYAESFTSTVDPTTTVDTWVAPASNPNFRIPGNSYQGDPLARLNLVFEGNTGNGLNVTNVGAFYNNAEPDFKSRLNTKTAPDPDGPFTSATRRRNAQRVASRTFLIPNGPPNAAPTSVGSVADAFLSSPGGPIQITTTTEHGLSTGDVVEITGVETDELGGNDSRLSPANGVFFITVIDANNFTLDSTDGAVIGDESPFSSGTWSYNNNAAFLYSGMGVSTFRIAQGFDGVGNGFQSGDSFLFEANRPGTITGELNFDWDTWVLNEDSFLAPFVSTFLTADISVAAPDPTNVSSVGDFIISFTEDVVDIGLDDFELYRNNELFQNLIGAVLERLDARTFRLNIDVILAGDTTLNSTEAGEYELRLINNTTDPITDAKYRDADLSYLSGFDIAANTLLFGDVERFTIDMARPTVEIDNVSPDPRSAAVGELVVNFSEDVTGVDLSDFVLTREGYNVAGVGGNLSSTLATLTQVTGSQFVLDLSKITSLSGTYTLTINTDASSFIIDSAGNALTLTDSTASVTWVNDTQAPTGTLTVKTEDSGTVTVVDFKFLEGVTGVDASDFKLYRNGAIVSGGVSSTTGADGDSDYTLELDSLVTSLNGVYTLVFLSEESDVTDDAGNAAASSSDLKWSKGTDFTAPTAGIEEGSTGEKFLINFSEPVMNVDDTDLSGIYLNFELWLDGTKVVDEIGNNVLSEVDASEGASGYYSSYMLDLSNFSFNDGLYTLRLLGETGTIVDEAGNAFTAGATYTWRIGEPVLQASIQGIPDEILTDAGLVSINFGDGTDPIVVDEVTLNDFRLTLNGQVIDLAAAGVTLSPDGASSSAYTLDLTQVTQATGAYELTLVAEGSDITGGDLITGDDIPLLSNAFVAWVKSSTIDLTGIDPTNVDRVDDTAGDGIIGDGTDGTVTLRAAIQEANALAGSNTIVLAAGTYTLGIDGIDEDQSASGDLDIRDNLTIRGQGVGVTIIDGAELDRIFQIFAGVTLNLENLTIQNGKLTGSDDGAGIRNSGTTTLTNVTVTGNSSEDSAGGINNTGLMIIVDSTISDNTAVGSGGGLRNTGTLQISRSTISGNTTERDGGALFNAGIGTVTVSNSTFSGNSADRSGGAIRNTATLSAINNTLTLNDAGTTGGAIANSGTTEIQNNLILGNTSTTTNPELDGSFTSLGGNLTGLVGSATGFGASDIVGVLDSTTVLDANLADNGGPTLTHALLLGSSAIDAGINANTDALEQRGSTRILGTNVDIGAVEFGAFFVNSLLDTVDDDPGDGIAADEDGNVTLRAAIMEANALAGDSVIILGAGIYDLTLVGSAENTSATGDLDITDTTGSLTILGAGSGQTIINAAGLTDERDRVFDIFSGADLTLQGVMITGGKVIGDSGGGIRNVGTLTLINSLVDGNAAEVDVDDITAVVNGGGILNGQLGLQGTLTLTNSDVTNNSAVDGGGIFNNDQSVITIVDSEISGNTASSDGGGLFNDLQATVDILRSSISGNTSTEDGGGIYNNDLASVTIADSKVNNNTADQGGGIFNEEAASLTIARTTVSGNTATQDGGGIYNDEGVVTLNQVSILTNTAAFDGGGMYNASAGQVTITGGMFDDNTANRDGGAIANFGVSLSLNGTIVRDSVAEGDGGGLFNEQEEGAVDLINTTFVNNEAVSGGAIYNAELGTINLDLSDLLNNTASANGGGIFNTAEGTVTVHRTTVDGNIALDGAGIFNDDIAELNLVDSTVSNNVASNDGGGLFNNSLVFANIVNATISGNEADSGAGIYNSQDGTLEITNTTITDNDAETGGGIFNEDGFVRVVNTIIAGNTATTDSDLSGAFISRGNNLIGNAGSSTGFSFGDFNDKIGVSAGLGALQDNGGATFTHELLGGSEARDAGNNFYAPTDDQRGFARLFDGDGNGSLVVDIGAFESGYIVTSFQDSVDAVPGDGVSVDSNGRSTLRAAIMEANAHLGADTILLGAGDYILSLFGLGENGALSGDLDITDDLTIIGAGSDRTFIDANLLDRIFHIFTDINVSIRGVTLINGSVTGVDDGGAILNFGNLTLEDVTIENSLANRGGALFNNGIVTMTDSLFSGNTAIADGGAIFNSDSGTATVDLSTISGNDAENGGGIFNSTGGTLVVNDTTIDGNTATVAGGGVFVSDEAAVGNGEGGGGVNVPAASSEYVVTGSDYDYDYPVYESGYESHSLPQYDNGDTEAAILSDVPPFPVIDTFNLSSLPGANHTIYLDFNGHTTTGTQWNTSFGNIVTPAYDTDGDVSSFSLAEIEVIQRTWLRVVEDFAPFNVNVTTVEPPVSDLMRTDASDTRWGIRVVVGENTWYSPAGGVAYVGSFSDNLDTPTYVFNTSLIGVAEAASHEVGHTLGLVHDGTSSEEYYAGHGSGPTGWAPIMGVGYSQDLVQWSQGEYTDANNSEDDLNIITTQNGFSYRADDHGSSIGTASNLIDGTASGIVERNTDMDFFQFTTTGGDVIIDPFFESPNLDILAILYDSSGTQIQTSNPTGALNASFIGLAAGTYFVSIEGTGEGDVLGTGYSDYGSLGQYTITVGGQPPPTVTAGNVAISNSTISNNFAGTRGGGLLNEDTIDISNVTFSGNEAGKEGGAIHNTGDLTINNTTIYDNFTEGTGGGIYSVADTASVSITNTIVAGNNSFVSGYDLAGTFTSLGYNLIGTSDSATGFIDGFNGDIVGTNAQRIDPALGELQDNGGPTETHALLAGSRAIDAGDNTDGISIDQRGATRPTDTTSDIGAFEIVTPTISISDVSQLETDGDTMFKFLVSLSNTSIDEVTVDYKTTNGTATAGDDYVFTTGSVTFAPGETTQIIEVVVKGDPTEEDHETFFVNLLNAVGASIGGQQAVGTIQNDEATITIAPLAPLALNEGNQGETTNFDFVVTLSRPITENLVLDVATVLGSADADDLADYDAINGLVQRVTFEAGGPLTQTVTVVVNGDADIEGNEDFDVTATIVNTLVDASVDVSGATATGTILNDDTAQLSINDVTMVEPDGAGPAKMIFTVTLSHPAPTGGVTFNYTTNDGTAIAGSDYTAATMLSGTINGDETSTTIEIDILSDTDVELDPEYFTVIISSAAIGISDNTGVGTIIDAGQALFVTTFDDELDAGDQDAGFDRADLSLREAIQIINNGIGSYHTIILDVGVYDMFLTGINENNNATGDFDIENDLTIIGAGSGLTTIDANGLDRIFHTDSGVTLNLSSMQLINGDADNGGAILAQGDTVLNQIIFQDNHADFLGGAIVSNGQLDITDAQFLNNHADSQGGALYQFADTATVGRTTFSENTSGGRAGAVYVGGSATFDVSQSLFVLNDAGSRGGAIFNEGIVTSTNVTFSANHAGTRGGAIFNTGRLTLLNNTLTLNRADQTGGGISNDSAENTSAFVSLSNTIVARNSGFLGNPDLGGAYDTTTSFNNLIGDIGAATGLSHGLNENIIGTLGAPIDPKLGGLLDNGGPTKTHTLLYGSPALDAGKNSDSEFNVPDVDQRGKMRRVQGTTIVTTPQVDIGAVEVQGILTDPSGSLYGTGGDASLANENTNIQLSVVKQKTVVASNGHTAALPGNEDWLQEWDSFWVEVWVDTATGFGISDVLTDIAYNTAYFSATSIEFGSSFAFNRTAVIDDAAGVVRNLGGSTLVSNVGGSGYALLARIKFESLAGDQVEVDPTDLTIEPLQLGLDIQNTQIDIGGVGEVTVNVGALPETDLYPVIYDIDDNDKIDYRDLIFFTSAYNQNVFNATSPYATALDFDKSGKVDHRDLISLVGNYGKKKSGSTPVNFPANFGQKWVGSQLEIASGDDSIDQVIEAAVDTWETALGVDNLEVQVVVRDFGTAQLGSGLTTEYSVDGIPVGGRVVIDNDANGLGWYVDVTDLPSGSAYDLYTVLLHEIGHVLGFTPYYSGFGSLIEEVGGDLVFVGSDFTVMLDAAGYHVDDPAYADDLMNDTLDPGTRKLISDVDVKMLLESYASAQSGSGSAVAAPIYGTNNLPTTDEVEPVLIQSQEAAQTFVEQSTMSLVAPAVIKSTEEEDSNTGIQQTATFDAFQPSVLSEQQVSDELELDTSLFEDLYSSSEFEDSLMDSETDDRQLVFAHAENELEWDLEVDLDAEQEAMDDAFTNWEGPLL